MVLWENKYFLLTFTQMNINNSTLYNQHQVMSRSSFACLNCETNNYYDQYFPHQINIVKISLLIPPNFASIFVSPHTQGITFEKARRATNRSLKMTIWSLGSDLCYEEKISARGRHYNTIRQGAPFHHCLSGRRHFNTTTRSL